MSPLKTPQFLRKKRSQPVPNPGNEKLFNFNSMFIFIGLSIFALGIVLQMTRWQIIKKDYFTALAHSQYTDSQRQTSGRGIILASDSTILATDQPAWNVFANLSSIESERDDFFAEKEKYVAAVAGTLGMKKNDLDSRLFDEFRYVPIMYNISTQEKKALEEMRIFENQRPGFGFYFEKSEKRVYPNGQLGSHILGFMGKNDNGEDKGVYGIEGYYFGDISGTEGFTYEEKDAYGNVILTAEYEPILPRRGKDIKLTIVPAIQSKVEEVLKKGVEQHQAKSGSVIIMDPKSGAIIAMANYPTYNPNEYWLTQEPWIFKNKAVADVYEPGSIFKPITVSIGLETDTITPETICNDETGYFKMYEGTPDEATIYTWDGSPDGKITPEEYLQYSNNPCIAQTALAVGFEKYYPIMKKFGIGDFIGIGLEDEANHYLKPEADWIKLDLAVTAFGQSIAATPLQMTSALSVFANHGKRMKPHIVSEVSDENEVIKFEPYVVSEPISAKTANTVAAMLRSVVTKGEAKWIFDRYLKDYDLAGKTGTSQIPKEDSVGYYDDRTNATFVGFGPVEDPKFIMLIRLEEPSISEYAAETAVPVWVETFLKVVDDLEIPKKSGT